MSICRILPDEFALGYSARLLTAQGFDPGCRDFPVTLARQAGFDKGIATKRERLLALARCAGIDYDVLVVRHTLAPAMLAFSKDREPKKDFGTGPRQFARLALGLKSAAPRLCVHCVEEDLQFWRCSYWRRSHQLPGISHCTKHGTRLISATTRRAVLSQPHHICDGRLSPVASSEPCLAERNMAAIWDGLTDFGRPLSYLRAVDLMERARVRNGRHVSHGFSIANKIRVSVPTDWLADHFGAFANRYVASRYQPELTPTYVLALAVLYEDPDWVISSLTNSGIEHRPTPKASTRSTRVDASTSTALSAFQSGTPLSEVLDLLTPTRAAAFENVLRNSLRDVKGCI